MGGAVAEQICGEYLGDLGTTFTYESDLVAQNGPLFAVKTDVHNCSSKLYSAVHISRLASKIESAYHDWGFSSFSVPNGFFSRAQAASGVRLPRLQPYPIE